MAYWTAQEPLPQYSDRHQMGFGPRMRVQDLGSLHRDARATWNANAVFWDGMMGDESDHILGEST